MQPLGIGQLAKRGGVRIDTVRYYERNGLLTPRTRLASGYRRYGELELARPRFIRRAQALGFSLKEVKELLALSAQKDVGRVKRSAQAKLVGQKAPSVTPMMARIMSRPVSPEAMPEKPLSRENSTMAGTSTFLRPMRSERPPSSSAATPHARPSAPMALPASW